MSIGYKTFYYLFLSSFMALALALSPPVNAKNNVGFAKKSNLETHENGWTSSELAFPNGIVLFRSSYLNEEHAYAVSFDRTVPECATEYISLNFHVDKFTPQKTIRSEPLKLEMVLDGQQYAGKYTFNMDPAVPIAYVRIVAWDETPENLGSKVFTGKSLELRFVEQLDISFRIPTVKVILGGYSDATTRTFGMCEERNNSDPFKGDETFI